MVIKGILEQITTSNVNLVNADLLAKTRGLRLIESFVPAEGTVRPCWQPTDRSGIYACIVILEYFTR